MKDEILIIKQNTQIYDRVTIFIVTPVGFEQIAQQELYEKVDLFFPDIIVPDIKLTKGGLEVCWELQYALLLNSILKIPTRILIRFDQFKCRDFPKLFNKIKQLPWNLFLTSASPKINVTTHHSRLINSKRISHTVKEGIKKYFKGHPPKKKWLIQAEQTQEIFIHFNNDLCTISLNSSGTALYKRGFKLHTGKAPIRENLAAALLYLLAKQQRTYQLTLLDPMCGSGTFLFEAALFYTPNVTRDFAYYHWPILAQTPAPLLEKLTPPSTTLYAKIIGHDKELHATTFNLHAIKSKLSPPLLSSLQIAEKDLFNIQPKNISHIPVVILNPPYGKRIKNFNHIEDFYNKIFNAINQQYSPKLLGMIIPIGFSYKKIIIKEYKVLLTQQFRNGGIPVSFYIFLRRE